MSYEHLRLRGLLNRAPLDPVEALKRIAGVHISPEEWRSNELKEVRETVDACLFAHGLAQIFSKEVVVIPGEVEDYDCALAAKGDGELLVAGVQLKELPPASLNADLTLPVLLDRLSAGRPTDAWLLIRLNKQGDIPDETLDASSLPFAEVWYLWAASPDGQRWCVHGDAKRPDARRLEFQYPQ